MQYDQIEKTLKPHIQAGRTQQAIEFVNLATDYHEGENMAAVALNEGNCPQEVIDAALERFITTRTNRPTQHGYWVHSLSHFTKNLWSLGLKSWIKRLNEIAFTGANELKDTSCSDRLVGDFAKHASWNSLPAEYGYTEENLRWACTGKECNPYNLARIKASPFQSEVESLRFEFGWPNRFKTMTPWTKEDGQIDVIDVEKIKGIIKKLAELGDNTSDLADIEMRLIGQFIAQCEKELKETSEDWKKKSLTKSIERSRAMLPAMA